MAQLFSQAIKQLRLITAAYAPSHLELKGLGA
jgi:hypothetical protein